MFSQSIAGINNSMAILDKAAAEAAKGPRGDIVKSQIGLIVASNSLGANVAVLKTANEMQKTLIDIIV
jgi:flagellar basal body rod protein FlgC